ncbi:MAG: flavin-dependent dehydrogenase [Cyanobacteria bacterium WB6_1B_304]|nr:flavin-dependent dehydrogenase [Cyanobacteria bacterium WB6_1B_304]
MKQLLYIEIPTPDVENVCNWLQTEFQPGIGIIRATPDGIQVQVSLGNGLNDHESVGELALFTWTLQRTTYLKVYRWTECPIPSESALVQRLTDQLRLKFPYHYPQLPEIDLSHESIFTALAPYYPLTAHYFQSIPNGEYDLTRAYWWEKRWRESVHHPEEPKQVVFRSVDQEALPQAPPIYDLIYVGGALGVIHGAVMAQRGYRVLLLERLPFGRMNREWNISRSEIKNLIDLQLLTPEELESVIGNEYKDGLHKFFDANNPSFAKAPILHTPTVLNLSIDSDRLLQLCGEKLKAAGGEIWEQTEFLRADISTDRVTVTTIHLPSQFKTSVSGRLLVDAMGTASPIAWQLNGKRTFDSVCPTVGACITDGFPQGVWDHRYGDVLNSHGDISRGRQLIWELFPGRDQELTIYLFHYHQVHRDNPGSLLEMYEDFFHILPEYRRCELDQLTWRKATFGYIPGHFSVREDERHIACDRIVAIGDAASLQSPLIFTGFGSLIRNLGRLVDLLDTALKHNLLSAIHLENIRAYQTNVSVTWLFSKGMMVPTGVHLPPQRINAMLNTFFGIIANEPPAVGEAFMKDQISWLSFNRMALRAAWQNPSLLLWIWQMAGISDLSRWIGNYVNFSLMAMISFLLSSWFPAFVRWMQPWLEKRYPGFWLYLLAWVYRLTLGLGHPKPLRDLQ